MKVYAPGMSVAVIDGPPTPVPVSGSGRMTVYAPGLSVAVIEPALPASAESYRIWDNAGTKNGANAQTWDKSLDVRWDRMNGDWIDANQVRHGSTPWATLVVPFVANAPPAYVDVDVTALAQRPHNKGIYLYPPASNQANAYVILSGSRSANPPKLIVNGTIELKGDMAAWPVHTSLTTPPSTYDYSQSLRLSKQMRAAIHFPGLPDKVTSAVLRLHVASRDDVYPLTVNLFETDPPPLLRGGGGLPAVKGLAAIGEANLPGHPDVLAAGDFRESNWSSQPGIPPLNGGVLASRGKPAGLFNLCSMNPAQYAKTKAIPDPDSPGRFILDTCIAQGQIGGGELAYRWHQADMNDPMRRPSTASLVTEAYVRVYMWFDPSSYWSEFYAFKCSPIGWDMRYGVWDDVHGWNHKGGSAYVFGSGQTPSDGKAYHDTTYNQWLGKGHSCRGHTMGWPHPTNRSYLDALGIGFAPSHLGPYDSLNDGGVYGTEQNLRLGKHVVPMGRWVCMESHLKMNSIDLSAPDAMGNGIARNDGVLELFMDGALVGGRYNMAWRRHPLMGIVGNWMMQYHGGGTKASHDLRWKAKDFVIARKYIGPRV